MEPYQCPPANPRVQATLWNIRVDAATAEVVDALQARRIQAVVLKGPALTDWYPDDSGRTYADGDVWVSPAAVEEVGRVLSELGFTPDRDDRGLPAWWLEHASNWTRSQDDTKIDLHARLQGVGLDPTQAWELLFPLCEGFTLAGRPALRLPAHARALYVTLHATHHGVMNDRGLAHLQAALRAVDDATWARALELAGRLQATAPFVVGLRLLPAGVELAQRIGAPERVSARAALQATSPPPTALGFEQLAAAGHSARARIVVRKLFPPAGFVRAWWPPAARNRRMLALGYAYRPIWLIRRAPAGYRAWRAAARASRSSS